MVLHSDSGPGPGPGPQPGAMCAGLGRTLSGDEVTEALAALDTDNSGTVTVDEFLEWWNGGAPPAAHHMTYPATRPTQHYAL